MTNGIKHIEQTFQRGKVEKMAEIDEIKRYKLPVIWEKKKSWGKNYSIGNTINNIVAILYGHRR